MFRSRRVVIDKDLYRMLAAAAETRGYASTDEFVRHVLAAAVHDPADRYEEAEVERQLRGLGYIE